MERNNDQAKQDGSSDDAEDRVTQLESEVSSVGQCECITLFAFLSASTQQGVDWYRVHISNLGNHSERCVYISWEKAQLRDR